MRSCPGLKQNKGRSSRAKEARMAKQCRRKRIAVVTTKTSIHSRKKVGLLSVHLCCLFYLSIRFTSCTVFMELWVSRCCSLWFACCVSACIRMVHVAVLCCCWLDFSPTIALTEVEEGNL